MLDKLQAAISKILADLGALKADVSRLKVRPVPKDGKDGRNAPQLAEIVAEVLAQTPKPKDGKPGKDAVAPAMSDIINAVLAKIPTPKDGKPGTPGTPGKDADPADIGAIVQQVLAQMPAPKVEAAMAAEKGEPGPQGKPGPKGKDGVSVTKVKLEKDGTLAVWLDGKRRAVGKLNAPRAQIEAFTPGQGGGGRVFNSKNFQPVAPTSQTFFVANGPTWESAVTTSTSNTYKWDEDTTATDPGLSRLKGNNAEETLITEIYLSESTLSGGSVEAIGNATVVGDLIRVQQFGATGNFVTMSVSATPTDNGGWWTIPVTVLENSGGFIQNTDVTLDYWPTGVRNGTIEIESLDNAVTNADYDNNAQVKLSEDVQVPYPRAKVTISMEPRSFSTNRSCVVGLFIDGNLIDNEYEEEPQDDDNMPWPCKVFGYDFTPGQHNFEVRFGRRGGAGGSFVALRNVRIFVEPV